MQLRGKNLAVPGLAFLALAVALQGCSSPSQISLYQIIGTVTIDGAPAESVFVNLRGGGRNWGTVITGEDGTYRFDGRLPVGNYTVTVSDFPEGVTFPAVAQEVELRDDFEFVELDFVGATGS